ncbi:Unknown protein sequence [Pseudomonas syringae pv. maculicola]|nr:Unknown protein sequence [Pseudomonas syringae pv. maculicola]
MGVGHQSSSEADRYGWSNDGRNDVFSLAVRGVRNIGETPCRSSRRTCLQVAFVAPEPRICT